MGQFQLTLSSITGGIGKKIELLLLYKTFLVASTSPDS